LHFPLRKINEVMKILILFHTTHHTEHIVHYFKVYKNTDDYYGDIFFIFPRGAGACAMGTMAQWPVQA